MSRQDLFERILGSLHEAVFDDERWPATSGLIDEACGSKGNALVSGDGAAQDDIEIFFARFCYRGQRREDLERLYFGTYHAVDERLPRIRRLPDSQVAHVDTLFSDEEKKTSPVYNEGLVLTDTRDCLNVRLDGLRGSRVVWVVADPVDGDGWTSGRVDTMRRLLPHLRQYVQVRQTLVDARALGSSAAMLLESSRCGVVQLDQRGAMIAASDIARGFLRQGDALTDSKGFLRAAVAEDDETLQSLLAQALPPFGVQGKSGSMTLRRTTVSPRLVLHVHPVGGGRPDARPSRIAALVLVVDPASRGRIDPALVGEVLGLTPAQSHVAVMLAQGHSIRDIARATGRSEGTIRWHTKQIFREHGISGQGDLTRLVLSLADVSQRRI